MAPKIKNRPPPVVRLLAGGVLCIFLTLSVFCYWHLILKSGDLLIESLLSTELIASIIICGAFFMAIRTIMGFTRDVSELRPKLVQLENTLTRLREALANDTIKSWLAIYRKK